MMNNTAAATATDPSSEVPDASPAITPPAVEEKKTPLFQVVKDGTNEEITERVGEELDSLVKAAGQDVSKYCLLGLYEPEDGIDSMGRESNLYRPRGSESEAR
jgi:hypothetical protein